MNAMLPNKTGRFPTNRAPIVANTEKKAERMRGTAVRAAAEEYDTEYSNASSPVTGRYIVFSTPTTAVHNIREPKFSSFLHCGQF